MPAPPKPKAPEEEPIEPDAAINAQDSTKPTKDAVSKPQALSPATLCIPRLLSVVEIIKREYVKLLKANRSEASVGLHQYNRLAHLEQPAIASEEERAAAIARALDGKSLLVPLQHILKCSENLTAI